MAVWEFTGIIPLVLLGAALICWKRYRAHRNGESPVQDFLLRPPGESLRHKVDDLNDQLLIPILAISITSVLLGSFTAKLLNYPSSEPRMQILLVSWSVGLALTIPFTWWLFTIIRKRDNYNLGFSGEQAVGEKLNLLMLDGYRVFHDFPCPRWNIDHIIVGPSGVYAVETKTRRKRRIAGKKAPQIFFDGKSLDFGQGKETSPLDQAERNARWLSDTLSKALAEPIQVQPVLTFPGWWVERQGQGKVLVLNHKEFYLILKRNGSALLSQQTIDRIVHRLEEKCRNVKF